MGTPAHTERSGQGKTHSTRVRFVNNYLCSALSLLQLPRTRNILSPCAKLHLKRAMVRGEAGRVKRGEGMLCVVWVTVTPGRQARWFLYKLTRSQFCSVEDMIFNYAEFFLTCLPPFTGWIVALLRSELMWDSFDSMQNNRLFPIFYHINVWICTVNMRNDFLSASHNRQIIHVV